MIRSIILYTGRKKNPDFKIDSNVSTASLFMFAMHKFIGFCRGLRLLFFLRVPRMLFLGSNVTLMGLDKIRFGKIVQIDKHVYLSGIGKQGMTIGNNVWIGAYSSVKVSFSINNIGEHIYIGNNVGIGEYAHLGGAGGLTIGDDCIIGPYFSCHPENHHFADPKKKIRDQGVIRKGINIGNNCWIGSKVTVLDGVTIGNNCVIAAGSVVNKSMPSNVVIGGVPARIIRKRRPQSSEVEHILLS
jgi:acetyltransferase-like isoleucine patch superfamily enzyme